MRNKEEKIKYALVTGGSRGIGKAICVQLAKDSEYKIIINYRANKEAALDTLSQVEALGAKGELLQFDVANSEEVTKDNLFMWMKREDWNSVIDTSLNGFFNVTNHLIQKLLVNRYGRIINMVSVSGLKGTAGQTNYSAAKGAVIGATKALAQEVAKRKITVNAVAPGFIASDMTTDLDENELKKMIPVNRFGKVEEVAHLVSFLASDKASYITGEVLNINGGIYS